MVQACIIYGLMHAVKQMVNQLCLFTRHKDQHRFLGRSSPILRGPFFFPTQGKWSSLLKLYGTIVVQKHQLGIC